MQQVNLTSRDTCSQNHYNLDTVYTSQIEANLPSSYALNRGLYNRDAFNVSLGKQPSRLPILLKICEGEYMVMGGHDSYLAQRDAELKYPDEVNGKQKVIIARDETEAKSMSEQRRIFNRYEGEGRWVSKEARNHIVPLGQVKLKKQQLTRFSKDEIGTVANKIMETGKLVNFPVVAKTGADTYSLNTGTLVYLAYSRAVELSQGKLASTIMVWVVNRTFDLGQKQLILHT